MHVRRYLNEATQPASPPKPCAGCYPILYQIFFTTDGNWNYEPDSLEFNFTDNELRQMHLDHEAMMGEIVDITNALLTCKSDKVLFCR